MASFFAALIVCVAMTTCMAASRYRRQATVVPASFRCPQPEGFFPIDGDCEHFVGCYQDTPHMYVCPKGLVFNPQTTQCDYPGNVPTCANLANPASAQYCSSNPGVEGQAYKVAHPDWCNAFYTCDNGYVHTLCEFCGEGTYFNSLLGECSPFNPNQQQTLCNQKTFVDFNSQALERMSNQCSTAIENPYLVIYNALRNGNFVNNFNNVNNPRVRPVPNGGYPYATQPYFRQQK